MSAATSWGEMVREVQRSKTTLPWEFRGTEKFVATKMVTQKDVKLKERELDPVLMQYRDADREKAYMDGRREVGRAKHSSPSSMFSLLSHTAEAERTHARKDARNGSRFHILSNIPHDKHLGAPTLYDEQFVQGEIKAHQNVVHNKPRPGQHKYHILTNNYYGNHEEIAAQEQKKLATRLDYAFWKTHKMDPILQYYYDPKLEYAKKGEDEATIVVRRQQQVAHLPETMVKSEGAQYNIINLENSSGEGTSILDSKVLSHIKTHAIEQDVREKSMLREDQDERRKLNRISELRKIRQLTQELVTPIKPVKLTHASDMWKRVQTSPEITVIKDNSSMQIVPKTSPSPAKQVHRSASSEDTPVSSLTSFSSSIASVKDSLVLPLDMAKVDFGSPHIESAKKTVPAVRTGGGLRRISV
jgi:hypothetical protein